MATRDLTRRFAELRVLQHGVEGSENKRPGDAFSESGLLDVSGHFLWLFAAQRELLVSPTRALFFTLQQSTFEMLVRRGRLLGFVPTAVALSRSSASVLCRWVKHMVGVTIFRASLCVDSASGAVHTRRAYLDDKCISGLPIV